MRFCSLQVSDTQTSLVNTRLQQLEEMMAVASGSANKSKRLSKVTAQITDPGW